MFSTSINQPIHLCFSLFLSFGINLPIHLDLLSVHHEAIWKDGCLVQYKIMYISTYTFTVCAPWSCLESFVFSTRIYVPIHLRSVYNEAVLKVVCLVHVYIYLFIYCLFTMKLLSKLCVRYMYISTYSFTVCSQWSCFQSCVLGTCIYLPINLLSVHNEVVLKVVCLVQVYIYLLIYCLFTMKLFSKVCVRYMYIFTYLFTVCSKWNCSERCVLGTCIYLPYY